MENIWWMVGGGGPVMGTSMVDTKERSISLLVFRCFPLFCWFFGRIVDQEAIRRTSTGETNL